jgi:hypothetical protein
VKYIARRKVCVGKRRDRSIKIVCSDEAWASVHRLAIARGTNIRRLVWSLLMGELRAENERRLQPRLRLDI